MAFRSRGNMLLKAAKNGDTVLTGEGGLRGFMQRLRERLSTGKLLRPDVEDDVLRIPVSEAKFRFPSPGAQQPPVVPQGPYKNVFDISYHKRDSRRRNVKEQVTVGDAVKAGLPPTAGKPVQSRFLGLAADFDRQS